MKTIEFNCFIKDYETIRSLLKNIYTYGCYNKGQLIKVENIKSKKFDNDSRRIRYFINTNNQVENRSYGKKILGLKYDRYDNIANFLVKSYKTKTFNSQDINLYFFILQILSRQQSELSINELILIIQYEILSGSDDDNISYRMLRDKLEEMCIMGIVEAIESKPLKYKLVSNILEDFTPEELNILHQVLYFYRNITPLSVLGYFAQETIKNHLLYFQGDDCLTKDVFLFKHTFLQNILNDEVGFEILNAQNGKNKIEFTYSYKTEFIITAIPLKIIIDSYFGRQYLFCYNTILKKPQIYKIDKISNIKTLNDKFLPDYYEKYLELIAKCWSMTQLNKLSNPMTEKTVLVEIDFIIEDEERYIFKRLEVEQRHGNIKKLKENHWLFSIEILSPIEMIPWIRSFGQYAKVRKSEKHDISERIESDWEDVLKEYGVI